MESQAEANLLGQIGRMLEQFKLPGLDAAAVLERRRGDIEAIAEANRVALAGVQDLARTQGEILAKTLKEIETLVREGNTSGSLARNPARIRELVQKSLQEALGNMRELGEIAFQSQSDALRVVSSRMERNLDELRAALLPPGSGSG